MGLAGGAPGPRRLYLQRSTGRRAGPAGGARRTRPSWQPSCRAGAGSSARWGGWHCCSGCGCSRSPSCQCRSALWGPAQTSPASLPPAPARGGPGRPCKRPRGLSQRVFLRTRIQQAQALSASSVPGAVWVRGTARDRANLASHGHTRTLCRKQGSHSHAQGCSSQSQDANRELPRGLAVRLGGAEGQG